MRIMRRMRPLLLLVAAAAAAAVALALLPLAHAQSSIVNQGCFCGELPIWVVGQENRYMTIAECNEYARNGGINKPYFSLSKGGLCRFDSVNGLGRAPDGGACNPTCDWQSKAGEPNGVDKPYGYGEYGSVNGANVYATKWYSCGWPSVSSGMYFSSSSTGQTGSGDLYHGANMRVACNTNWVASGNTYYECQNGNLSPGFSFQCIRPCTLTAAEATAMGVDSTGNCGGEVPAGQSCNVGCTLPRVLQGSSLVCPSYGGSTFPTRQQLCAAPCSGPPAPVEFGNWTLLDSSAYAPNYPVGWRFQLTCGDGYTAINGLVSCRPDGTYRNDAFCLDMRMVPSLDLNINTLGQYKADIVWGNEMIRRRAIPASRFTHRVQRDLLFPSRLSVDKDQLPLKGVQWVTSLSFASTGSSALLTLTADTQKEIEHARYEIQIQSTYTEPSTGVQTLGPVTVNPILMPCACDLQGAIDNERLDPMRSVQFGTPLNLQIQQTFDDSNQILLAFRPNSMCADEWAISVRLVNPVSSNPDDPTPLTLANADPRRVEQLHVENLDACGTLLPQTEQVVPVAWPMHGRQIELCIAPLPRSICPQCTSQYGTPVADFGLNPATCILHTPEFFVSVSGKVTTAQTIMSTDVSPVPEVEVTVELLDAVTKLPVMEPMPEAELLLNPSLNVTRPVRATAKTDGKGRYKVLVRSAALFERQYAIRVTPYKLDVDAESGASLVHEFVHSEIPSESHHEDLTAHAGQFVGVNFVDKSEVTVRGSVRVPETSNVPVAFRGCGVPSVVIEAYRATDTERLIPVRRTLPTPGSGEFAFSVPLFTKLVLVPKYTRQVPVQGSPEPVHAFEPASLAVSVKLASIALDPFFDVTVQQFTARIDGGKCKYHIGMVRPVIRLETCGEQAHYSPAAFGSAGTVYTLPAMRYTFQMFDSKDSLTGLQSRDLGDRELPVDYLNGPLYVWIISQPKQPLDLTSVGGDLDTMPQLPPPTVEFNYRATAAVSLLRQPECYDPKVAAGLENKYTYLWAKQTTYLNFSLEETYGYVTPSGDNYQRVCRDVDGAVALLDDVTERGAELKLYAEQGCTTGQEVCDIPAVYDPVLKRTVAQYFFVVGSIERLDHADPDDDTKRLRPAFTRGIQFTLSGSVLPYQSIWVAILGTYSFPGAIPLTYPPFEPLYILRDPPGGGSTAALTQGQSISNQVAISNSHTGEAHYAQEVSVGGDVKMETCIGIGAASCTMTMDIESEVAVSGSLAQSGSETRSRTQSDTVSFETTVTTSDDPNLADGDGDLFLTVSGTMLMSNGEQIQALPRVFDPLTGENSMCVTVKQQHVGWKKGEGNTLQWSSAWDIREVIVPSFEKANREILAAYRVLSVDQLPDAARIQYKKNQRSVVGWNGLLIYNQMLKDNAEPFPEFYQHMESPRSAKSDVTKKLIDAALDSAAKQAGDNNGVPMIDADAGKDPLYDKSSNPEDKEGLNFGANAAYSLRSDGSVGSISFFGRSASLEFTLTTESTKADDREWTTETVAGLDISSTWDSTLFGVDVGMAIESGVSYTFTHGEVHSSAKTHSSTVYVQLSDPDAGDHFQVEIKKDPVYGSPVYKLLSGKTRCKAEAGTRPREQPVLTFVQPAYQHVHPSAKVSTLLALGNLSPTGEEFDYRLALDMASSRKGLILSVNGLPLTDAGVVYTLPAGVSMQVTIDVLRGSNGYDFSGITLTLTGEGDSGDCASTDATFAIQYDQPCSLVEFAGPLMAAPTFLLNQRALLNTPGELPLLSVTIRNPEYSLPGRQWLDQYAEDESDRFLQSVQVQYRSAPAGQILSEFDWAPVDVFGSNGNTVDLLANLRAQLAATQSTSSDYMSVTWDLSALSDGPYQLRAVTQCRVPAGALDTSLYTSRTSTVLGSLDLEGPSLFGVPVPSVFEFLPGQPITVAFDQTINCASYFGKARAQSWLNPTGTNGAQRDGLRLNVRHLCRDNQMQIAFLAPIWSQLVGRLVTVHVDRIFDTGGNEILVPVQWSFRVANFDASSSPVRIQNVQASGRLSDLIAKAGNLAKLQAAIANEVSELVNQAMDTYLQPTPLASRSLDGLQPTSVVVGDLATVAAALFSFSVTIVALPLFPGEPAAKFSPDAYAHYFELALRAMEDPATAAPRVPPIESLQPSLISSELPLDLQPAQLNLTDVHTATMDRHNISLAQIYQAFFQSPPLAAAAYLDALDLQDRNGVADGPLVDLTLGDGDFDVPVLNPVLLYGNNETYPILSRLLPFERQQLAVHVRAMPTAEGSARLARQANTRSGRRHHVSKRARVRAAQHAREQLAVQRLAMPADSEEVKSASGSTYATSRPADVPVSLLQMSSTFESVSQTNTLAFTWQVTGELATSLSAAALTLEYADIPSEELDPQSEEAATGSDSAAAPSALDLSSEHVSLQQNVRRLGNDSSVYRALYRLMVSNFPSRAGGREVLFKLRVQLNASEAPEYETSFRQLLVSVASQPVLRSVAQTSVDALRLDFMPSWNNGMAVDAGDVGIRYTAVIEQLAADGSSSQSVAVTLAEPLLQLTRTTTEAGAAVIVATVSLVNSSAIGLRLPAASGAVTWRVSVVGESSYGSSPASSQLLVVQSKPAALQMQLAVQRDLTAFDVFALSKVPAAGAAPVDSYLVHYRYVDSQSGNVTEGVASLHPVEAESVSAPALTTPGVSELLRFPLTLPQEASRAFAQLEVAVQASSKLGLSPLKFFAVSDSEFSFAPAPTNVTMALRGFRDSPQRSVDVAVSWLPADDDSDVYAYRVEVAYTDGMLLAGTAITAADVPVAALQMVRGRFVHNLTVPLIESPNENAPVAYSVNVAALVWSSLSSAAARRHSWANSVNTVSSLKSSVTLQCQQQSGASCAVTQSPLGSSLLPPSSPLLQPNHAAEVISSSYAQLSGSAAAGAPSTPDFFDIIQLQGTGRLQMRFPLSASGAPRAYILTYADSSAAQISSSSAGSFPVMGLELGSIVVSPLSARGGFITQQIDDAALRVSGAAGSHVFLFTLSAVNDFGSSATLQKFARVRSVAAAPQPDSWPSSFSSITVASLAINLAVLVIACVLLWLSRRATRVKLIAAGNGGQPLAAATGRARSPHSADKKVADWVAPEEAAASSSPPLPSPSAQPAAREVQLAQPSGSGSASVVAAPDAHLVVVWPADSDAEPALEREGLGHAPPSGSASDRDEGAESAPVGPEPLPSIRSPSSSSSGTGPSATTPTGAWGAKRPLATRLPRPQAEV